MIDEPLQETAEDLYENAPCGYLTCTPDGAIVRVNRTFERWTGLEREALRGRRFAGLLTAPGRIYHETHYAPLLRMQGEVREIALEIVRADGSRLPALVNSVEQRGEDGETLGIRTTVFDATERRRYEQELLRARRREHEIALELQRGLLAGARPETDGLAIDVVYRPASAELEAGGDWHDAFWLDGGRIALVVGDVVGRGITAAATMGQLRSAVRALAMTGLRPGGLLEALDAFARRHGVGRMTTLVYAELDPATRELRYAVAGHLPPVVAAEGEPARFLDQARSTPLDATLEPGPRPEAVVTLTPGAVLLLYTDGLLERRDRPLDDGLRALRTEVDRRGPALDLEDLARTLEDPGHADDLCVVRARLAT